MRTDAVETVREAGSLVEMPFRLPDQWQDRISASVTHLAVARKKGGRLPIQGGVTARLAALNPCREVMLTPSSWQRSMG